MTTLLYFFFFGTPLAPGSFIRIPPEARSIAMPPELDTVRMPPEARTIQMPIRLKSEA